MTLRCKPFLFMVIVLTVFLSGCVEQRYDSNCTQGLDISFFSRTICQPEPTYPEEITDLLICVFDNDDVLADFRYRENIALSRDYSERIEIGNGLYMVTAWSGIDVSVFDIDELQNGVTKKDDLLFRLKRTGDNASPTDGLKVYHGESRAVYVPKAGKSEVIYENAKVNLLEVTNRLTVTVEGLEGDIEDYSISIESDNGSMNVDGSIADDQIVKYEPVVLSDPETLRTAFTTLKLETGYNNTIIIKNDVNGTELYRGSLLGTLILKNPEVNLNCDHDFEIRFTAEDQCQCGTYTITEIWVNNWLVHSYDAEM